MHMSPRLRAGLRAFAALTGLALLAYVLHTAFGLGSPELDGFFQDWVYCGLIVAAGAACVARAIAVEEERAAWLVMGVGLVAWAAGEVTWTLASPTIRTRPTRPWRTCSTSPSIRRATPRCFCWPARAPTPSAAASGSTARSPALTVAALIATLAFQPIVDATSGGPAEIAVNLAYPVGDLLLLGLVVAVFGLNGWRPDPVWLLLGGGLALTAVADGLYLVQSATDQYVQGTLLDLAWPASALLVAVAAWQPARKKITIQDWLIMAVPVGCGLVAVELLVYDHFERVNAVSVSLAAWALLLALARMALAFLENQRTLAQTHTEARTDSLTGLKNRRSLLADLELQLELLEPSRTARAAAVRPRRLQGVQRRLRPSRRRRAPGAPRRAPGRRGGLERARLPAGRRRVLRAGARPVATASTRWSRPARPRSHERGEGFEVGTSFGSVMLPEEATTPTRGAVSLPTGACTPARAGAGCPQAASPATSCCGLCPSAAPTFTCGSATSAELALAVGRELHMGPEGLDEVARAAELHDVGKIAVPDAILDKPGPLDPVEWSFMRRHPADRRADPARGAGAAPGGAACALEPRALGRRRLPGRAARGRDPARSAGGGRLRRVRRHDDRSPLPRSVTPWMTQWRSCAAARGRSSTRWWWRRFARSSQGNVRIRMEKYLA